MKSKPRRTAGKSRNTLKENRSAVVSTVKGTAMPGHITVSVDPDVADVYRSASDDDRRKLDLLINLRLREATESKSSLRTILLEISHDARRRGLTPEILQSILGEK